MIIAPNIKLFLRSIFSLFFCCFHHRFDIFIPFDTMCSMLNIRHIDEEVYIGHKNRFANEDCCWTFIDYFSILLWVSLSAILNTFSTVSLAFLPQLRIVSRALLSYQCLFFMCPCLQISLCIFLLLLFVVLKVRDLELVFGEDSHYFFSYWFSSLLVSRFPQPR